MSQFLRRLALVVALLTATCGPASAIVGDAGPLYPVHTTTTASSFVAKSGPGTLYGFSATSSVAGFYMLFDATSAPADGTVAPLECYQAAGGSFGVSYDNVISMNSGITIAFSTTGCVTKTASTTTYISAQVR